MVFLLRIFALLPLFLTAAAPTLMADTPLIFKSNPQDLRTRQIEEFLIKGGILPGGQNFQIAKIDLNRDGIDETIFRHAPTGCEDKADCLHVIGGVSARAPAHIATIRARKIGISPENAYGVAKILVYNQKQNDFQYIIYVWNPKTSSFEGP